MNALAQPLAYTVRECASALRVSERTVHRLIKSGALVAVHIGRAVRIPAEEISRLIEAGFVPSREDRHARG